jgi:ribosomal protein S18 acetylase RimI-like enzyme
LSQIQIVQPQLAHAGALREIYLSMTSGAPHCRFVPDVERFGMCLVSPQNATTRVFVAEEHGMPKGFAALGRAHNETDDSTYDAITALFFAHAEAGRALLKACEAQAASGDVLAFPAAHSECPIVGYNGGWDGLPDRIPSVARLLARHGYAPYYRELHLTCDLSDAAPVSGAAPAGISLRESLGEYGQHILQALVGDREAGVCHYKTLARLGEEAASRTGSVWWLHVEPDARRRGVGRYLMLEALDHLRRQGCDTCWLTTGADNWPAQPLYLALGFEIVDCSASYRKTKLPVDALGNGTRTNADERG